MSTRKTPQPKAQTPDVPRPHAAAKPSFSAEPGTPGPETTQAERAAMHPDRHDLEWRYYHGSWSS